MLCVVVVVLCFGVYKQDIIADVFVVVRGVIVLVGGGRDRSRA